MKKPSSCEHSEHLECFDCEMKRKFKALDLAALPHITRADAEQGYRILELEDRVREMERELVKLLAK